MRPPELSRLFETHILSGCRKNVSVVGIRIHLQRPSSRPIATLCNRILQKLQLETAFEVNVLCNTASKPEAGLPFTSWRTEATNTSESPCMAAKYSQCSLSMCFRRQVLRATCLQGLLWNSLSTAVLHGALELSERAGSVLCCALELPYSCSCCCVGACSSTVFFNHV